MFRACREFQYPLISFNVKSVETTINLVNRTTKKVLFCDNFTIAQFRYIKIQPKTIDLSTRLVGINPTNSVVIPTSLVLRSFVLG